MSTGQSLCMSRGHIPVQQTPATVVMVAILMLESHGECIAEATLSHPRCLAHWTYGRSRRGSGFLDIGQ